MNSIISYIKATAATIGIFLGGLLGGMDGLIKALLFFVIVDYISGITVAVMQKSLSSQVGFVGIAKKVGIFALVGAGHILDTKVIGSGSALRTAVIMFYLANEGISLLENMAIIGVPVPKKLKNTLAQLGEEKANE